MAADIPDQPGGPPQTANLDASYADDPLASRDIDTGGRGLRRHAARGLVINSAFQVGLAGIGFLNRIIVAAFLTREQLGLWGIILITLISLAWLKQVGIADKYIQQSEPNQEHAFQKAFTIELLLSIAFFVLLVVVLPIYGAVYDAPEIVLPGIVLALSVPIGAFETPVWIAYRRMQFVRQRTLTAIDPVVAVIVTIVLGALGTGYWCLVIGVLAGSTAGAVAATATSPYPLRLRFERGTVREYASFSWPLLGYGLSNLVVVQGVTIVGARTVGIAGVGVITLVSAVSQIAERVDAIVSETLYPAICAVADRTQLLFEAFIKSNRLALMWSLPFGVGLALFAGDLVHFVLGDRWESAIGLLAAFGLIVGFRQIAFNWQIFMRAVNRTRPIFVGSLVGLGSFVLAIIPLMIAFGLPGYAAGMAIGQAVQLVVRTYYMRKLFPEFRAVRHLIRSILPSIPGPAVILLLRALVDGHRTLPRALAEVALYLVVTAIATFYFERRLLAEMVGYLRGKGGLRSKAQALPQTAPREPSRA
ncbi:MAG: lipopolysaccharide exporter [Thermoleophilaceae bacterium]|jgi:O-antigen/teichoic acid export membrane protein|nr:lipopolysaccharide exporter [Thermoleophilaceae bacterium]